MSLTGGFFPVGSIEAVARLLSGSQRRDAEESKSLHALQNRCHRDTNPSPRGTCGPLQPAHFSESYHENLAVDESESDGISAIQVPLHDHGIITNNESQTDKSMTLAEDLSREGGLEDEVIEAAFVICWPK